MNDILELVKELDNSQKYKLLEQLKKIINSEFEVNEINEEICCPKCNKINFSKMGFYNETQRYICKECNTTFTSKIRTIFSTTKLEKEKWLKYAECFVDVLSLRRCAEKVNVCLKTSFFMRHRIIECISKNIEDFRVGTKNKVQLDETYLRENFKGNHTKGTYFTMPRKARKDGHASLKIGSSNEQICISCGINDSNDVFLEIAGRGQLTNLKLEEILKNKIEKGTIVSTDKRSNYKTILKKFGIENHLSYKSEESLIPLASINSLHSRFKQFIQRMHGVSTRRLNNYLIWFTWIESFKRNDNREQLLYNQLLNVSYDKVFREYKNTPFLYMEYWNNIQNGLT